MTDSKSMSRAMPALAAVLLFIAISALGQPLTLTQRAKLPSVEGRIDHMDIDVDGNRLFVAALGAGSIEVIDLRTGKRVGLRGHPEAFEFERAGPHLYVNVPSAGHIAVVDRSSAKLIATWRLGSASSNYPMALDEPNRLFFIATRQPARLLVYDTTTGKRTAELPVCGDADDLF